MKIIYNLLIALMLISQFCFADQDLIVTRVDQLPLIDGIANDAVWQQAKSIITFDPIANAEIELRAIYTANSIAFLVQYADSTESREHKQLHWDPNIQLYKLGKLREDALVFKWNMDPLATDISLQSNQPYKLTFGTGRPTVLITLDSLTTNIRFTAGSNLAKKIKSC